jgi:transposase
VDTATVRREVSDRRCSMKKRQPRAYSLEFREEAMRQVQAGTKSIRELARELGVHVETLRNWRRDARVGGYEAARTGASSVDEENRELRRENARLKEERDILKKATAFFARDAR